MIINLKNNCYGSNWSKVKGVYQIRCLINNKIYIGSTSKLNKRFNKHKRNLINNRHHSIALQNAFNKYGIDKFEFSILEECDDLDKLQELEQFYLDYYQSYDRDKGYNILKDAYRGARGFKHSEETKRKISQSAKNMWKNPVIRNKILNNTSRIKSKETCERISKSKQKFNYSKDYLNYLYNDLNMKKSEIALLLNCTERCLKDNLNRMGVKKSKENFDKMMCDIRRNKKSKDFKLI